MKDIINAVIVTYNRKSLLEECIDALLAQSYEINKIYIIDNFSNDGTDLFLKEKYANNEHFAVFRLSKNYGGAGGFYYGICKAYLDDCDWIWAMDDDTIPTQTALQELVLAKEKIAGDISFLASTVYGSQDEPMNVPTLSTTVAANGYPDWYYHLNKGVVKISDATLVSLMFSSEAIKKVGAPHPDFFIWGDDTEYTLRMTRYYAPAYFVGRSKVIHKRFGAKALSMLDEDNVNRIRMYSNYYRNNLVVLNYYFSKRKKFSFERKMLTDLFKIVFSNRKYKIEKIKSLYKGLFNYLFGKYGKRNFNNRFNNVYDDLLKEDI